MPRPPSKKGLEKRCGVKISQPVYDAVVKHLLPRIPVKSRKVFYRTSLPELIKARPRASQIRVIGEDLIDHVPGPSRAPLVGFVAPRLLKKADAAGLREYSRVIRDSVVSRVPENCAENCMRLALPESVEMADDPKGLEAMWGAIPNDVLAGIPENVEYAFFNGIVPTSFRSYRRPRKLKAVWSAVGDVIGDVPDGCKDSFYRDALSKSFEHRLPAKRIRGQWGVGLRELLPLLPEEERKLAVEGSLSSAVVNAESEERLRSIWREVARVIPQLPKRTLTGRMYREVLLAEHLSTKPSPRRFREVWGSILNDMHPMASKAYLDHRLSASLVGILRENPSGGQMRVIGGDVFSRIPRDALPFFLDRSLPDSLKHFRSPKELRERWNVVLDEIMPSVPKESRAHFLGKPVSQLFERGVTKRRAAEIRRMIEDHGYSSMYASVLAPHTQARRSSFLRRGSNTERLPLEKTGSELEALGGDHLGVIVRKIEQEAYEAWKRAEDAGIRVEPILRNSRGKRREIKTKDGHVKVFTRYVGPSLAEFQRRPDYPKYERSLNAQKGWINAKMKKAGIMHGHTHESNFTVEMVRGRPQLRLIDFDMAKSDDYSPHMPFID